MPIIPTTLPESPALHEPEAGSGASAALDQAAALWAAKAETVRSLAAPPDPAGFPDPSAFADALENWRDGLTAAAENALEGRPAALEAWRAWFREEGERLAPHLEQAALAAAMQRAGQALRQELDQARSRALDPARPGDAEAASRDAWAALETAVSLGVLEETEAERTAAVLAAQVQSGLAARAADQDPANFLKALAAKDFPALAPAERERLAERAGLRLALAQGQAAQDAARAAEDAKRLPAERGRVLLRKAAAGLRAALEQGGMAGEHSGAAVEQTGAAVGLDGPAVVQDAARELAALPGYAAQGREFLKSLAMLPAARALLDETRFAPPQARFAAFAQAAGLAPEEAPGAADGQERGRAGETVAADQVAGRTQARPTGQPQGPDAGAGNGPGQSGNAGKGRAKTAPARTWPGPLADACRKALDEQAAALAADPAGFVRPEAERRLRAAGLDPAAEREALLHLVLDLQAQAGVAQPVVLSRAEAAALRQEWRSRDAAGQVEFLAAFAPFAGFRHRVAIEVLGPRGPLLLLAAESPALCPAEKAAVLAAAYAKAPAQASSGAARQSADSAAPDAADQPGQPASGPAPDHPALAALAASEPQAARVLAALAQRLAATTGDPEDAARLLNALAPEALRLWGQAPTLTPQPEHESPYRQDEAGSLDQIGDENTTPPNPDEEDDTLKGGAGQDTLPKGQEEQIEPGEVRKPPVLRNPTGGQLRMDVLGDGHFGAIRRKKGVIEPHEGVDVRGEVGAPVNAPMDGQLVRGPKGDLILSTKTGNKGELHSVVLAHVDHNLKAGKGMKVKEGDVIGTVQDPAKYVEKDDPNKMTPHAHLGLFVLPNGDWNKRKALDPNEHLATRLYDRDGRPVPPNGGIGR
jgi:murein DD-endopeptidase MepM/ murein hydrolase activator NlpD